MEDAGLDTRNMQTNCGGLAPKQVLDSQMERAALEAGTMLTYDAG